MGPIIQAGPCCISIVCDYTFIHSLNHIHFSSGKPHSLLHRSVSLSTETSNRPYKHFRSFRSLQINEFKMHAIQTVSLLALAGSAVAAPWSWSSAWGQARYNNGGNRGHWDNNNNSNDDNNSVATEVVYATAYTTVEANGGRATATAVQQQQQTQATEQAQQQEASTWAAWSSSAPAATATAVASSGDSGYMSVVNEWRQKMSMSELSQDNTLQNNALKTVQNSDGSMVHELNPGTMAQVLAPGTSSDFENVFVGGWLCEIPTLPGLDGVCSTMSAGWSYNGETGHAKILTATSYSKIGCALYAGIWACDLA